MIVALSRLTIANDLSEAAPGAFRDRPRLVDAAPGFLGMAATSPLDGRAEIPETTRWRDEPSRRNSPRGHDRHHSAASVLQPEAPVYAADWPPCGNDSARFPLSSRLRSEIGAGCGRFICSFLRLNARRAPQSSPCKNEGIPERSRQRQNAAVRELRGLIAELSA
jgi:heme-degrading monooxygenase HmoA